MNRYPLWKYITVVVALVIGFIYTLPNFFGESPAVQLSSVKATIKVDTKTLERAEGSLKSAGIAHDGIFGLEMIEDEGEQITEQADQAIFTPHLPRMAAGDTVLQAALVDADPAQVGHGA